MTTKKYLIATGNFYYTCIVLDLISGISEVKSVLQIIIDQVSQQQTAVEQLIARVTSLEQAHNKQKMVLSHYANKVHKNGVKQRHKEPKRNKAQKVDEVSKSKSTSVAVDAQKDTKSNSNSVAVDAKKKNKVSNSTSVPVDVEELSRVSKSNSVPIDQKMQPNSTSDGGQAIHPKKKGRKLHIPKRIRKIKADKSNAMPASSKCPARVEEQVQPLECTKLKEPTDSRPDDLVKAPIPYPIKENDNALSALEIDHGSLISIDEVLHRYESYVIHGSVSGLCRKLAREAIFGDDILIRCTPKGATSYPALPTEPFNLLKKVLFEAFPDHWNTPSDFEKAWLKCVTSIEGICSTLRKQKRRKEQELIGSPASKVTVNKSPAVKEITDVINPLSSAEIPKSELMSISDFLSLHSTAIKEGKYEPGYLTRRLAIDAVFGKKVLIKCTPFGRSTFPGLPVAEFNLLKQTVLDCNPTYWECVESFEEEWTHSCTRFLGNVCSKLRTHKVSKEVKNEV